MATEAYTSETVKLRDGTEVLLVPLAIFDLREFMRIWGEYLEYLQKNADKPEAEQASELEIGEKQFDVFHQLSVLCLAEELKGNKSDEEFSRYIGKTLDEHTMYKVFDRCGGLKLGNDPNLPAALTETQAAAGTN